METYNLVIEGTTVPGGDEWNEFGESIARDHDGTRYMDGPVFEDFLVGDSEDFFETVKDKVLMAFDIAQRLTFSNIESLTPLVEDFDPEENSEDEEFLPWPTKVSWTGTVEMQIKDAAMVPLIREMIAYIGKMNGENSSTDFKLVSLEPQNGAASGEYACAQKAPENGTPFDRENTINAFLGLTKGVSVTITTEDEPAGNAEDILYGTISR
jgi:hypothetical protein